MISNREYKILKLVIERQLDYYKLLEEVVNGKIVNQFEISGFYKKGYFERTSTSCPTLTVTNFAFGAIEEYEAHLESSKLQIEANEISKTANSIAEKALKKAQTSNIIAIASSIIALLSIIVSIIAIILKI